MNQQDRATESTAGHEGALERLDAAEFRNHVATQHWARYEWAAGFLPAKRVLDCACGVGYGSNLLRRRGAAFVLGLDVSEEAVVEARRRYPDAAIEYRVGDARELDPAVVGQFDLIVSLETLEHMTDPQRALDAFARVLAPGGVLALSLPNEKFLGVQSPFHAWVADFDEVRRWLSQRFAHSAVFGETHVVGTIVWPDSALHDRPDADVLHAAGLRLIDETAPTTCPGFLFACSQAPLRTSPSAGSVLLGGFTYVRELEELNRKLWDESGRIWNDTRQSTRNFEAEIARLMRTDAELHKMLEEKDVRIRELDAQVNAILSDARESSSNYQIEIQRLQAEQAKLGSGFDDRGRRVEELEQHAQKLWEELQRSTANYQAEIAELLRTRTAVVDGFEERGRRVLELERHAEELRAEIRRLRGGSSKHRADVH